MKIGLWVGAVVVALLVVCAIGGLWVVAPDDALAPTAALVVIIGLTALLWRAASPIAGWAMGLACRGGSPPSPDQG